MKKAGLLLLALLCLSLCACGSIYEKEYTVIEEYRPASPIAPDSGNDRVTVRNFTGLRQAIQGMVNAGSTEGSIVFDENYEGDTAADMSSACWQVRTQNALCAYCVENISYELSSVMTNDEAKVSISYGDTGCSVEDIIRKPYATGLDLELRKSLEEGSSQLVLLINYSTYTAADMETHLSRLYRQNPMMSPAEPRFSVSLYSGSGIQRLYDISIDYGISAVEREARMQELRELDAFAGLDTRRMTEPEKALKLAEYLCQSCSYSPESGSSVYDCLAAGSADSEGIAMGVVALARQLGLECEAVYGQRSWQDHCWNIIRLDGDWYHIDLSRCIEGGIESGFLKNDLQMWTSYRWDTSAYQSCTGQLSYNDIVA